MRNFIIIFTILLLALLNTACSQDQIEDLIHGAPKDPRTHYGVDPAFRTYVNAYEAKLGSEVYGIPINFVQQDAGRAGVCYLYTERDELWKEIQIDRQSWTHLTERQKTALVFHELEHCVNEVLTHINDLREDNCSFSIMYPYIQSDVCLERYEDDYMFNLFN